MTRVETGTEFFNNNFSYGASSSAAAVSRLNIKVTPRRGYISETRHSARQGMHTIIHISTTSMRNRVNPSASSLLLRN
jgi:hypothetical protein